MIVDEGEAEAQRPEPVVTIRLLTPGPTGFPIDCRVEVESAWSRVLGGRAGLDAFLHERVVGWAQSNDWVLDGEPTLATEVVEDVPCRTATFTVRGLTPRPGL